MRILIAISLMMSWSACADRKQPHAPTAADSLPDAPGASDAQGAITAGTQSPQHNDGPEAPVRDPAPIGFLPANCLDLKAANPSLPSGTYTIYPFREAGANAPVFASCDMDSDGGGWTLILNYNHRGNTNPELDIRVDRLPLLGSSNLGVDESQDVDFWGHAGNELLRELTGFRELRFYCRSSENTRILHFKTADPACIAAVQFGTGSCGDIRKDFVPMPDHSAILPGSADRAEFDRMDVTLTYNTFGRTEVDMPDRMWSIRAEPGQQVWECDYGTNNAAFHTLHRVWIR